MSRSLHLLSCQLPQQGWDPILQASSQFIVHVQEEGFSVHWDTAYYMYFKIQDWLTQVIVMRLNK